MRIFLIIFLANFLYSASDSELIIKAMTFNLKPLEIEKNIFALENKSQIELGKKLYFDPRISNSNLISCNTCHNLALGGSNAIATAKDFNRNVPTIFNTAFNAPNATDNDLGAFKKHLMAHITGESKPQKATQEKAQNALVAKITAIPSYIVDFKKAYGNNVSIDFELITKSLVAFQSTLKTQSRFDDFLRGNFKALSRAEQEGLDIFIDKGCVSCHNGVNLGGEWVDSSLINGYKFAFSGAKIDNKIKIPTLRNILETAPYLANGSGDTLKGVIAVMTKDNISDDETRKIEIFFGALSGKKPTIIYPQLPMQGVESVD